MRLRKGFTLIELLVVIAIIAILATMVYTSLGNTRVKARVSAAKSDVVQAGKAIEQFKNSDAASDYVIDNTSAGVDTLNYDGSGSGGGTDGSTSGIKDMFTGTLSVTGLTYPAKFTKTPANGFTYSYATDQKEDSGFTRDVTTAKGYMFSTDEMDSVVDGDDENFYVLNGGTGSCESSCPAITAP